MASRPIAPRVRESAERVLANQQYVRPVDVLLGVTRTAKAASGLPAVVVRWSGSRQRYERQGIVVEPAALTQGSGASGADPAVQLPPP